jgi:hypothetical protein
MVFGKCGASTQNSVPEPLNPTTPLGKTHCILPNIVETFIYVGRVSVVCVATGYRLDGPGIESRQGLDFFACPDRPWGPPSPLYNGHQVFPRGKAAGM